MKLICKLDKAKEVWWKKREGRKEDWQKREIRQGSPIDDRPSPTSSTTLQF